VARVTVVNDNPEFLELVGEILTQDRYETTLVDGDAPDAIERVRGSQPDVLMIDLRMGHDELHGWRVVQQVRADASFADLPILLCSADSRALQAIEGELADTHNVVTLTKPFQIDELMHRVDELLSQPQTQ
jgi:CheY-like chemotaxis protein